MLEEKFFKVAIIAEGEMLHGSTRYKFLKQRKTAFVVLMDMIGRFFLGGYNRRYHASMSEKEQHDNVFKI